MRLRGSNGTNSQGEMTATLPVVFQGPRVTIIFSYIPNPLSALIKPPKGRSNQDQPRADSMIQMLDPLAGENLRQSSKRESILSNYIFLYIKISFPLH